MSSTRHGHTKASDGVSQAKIREFAERLVSGEITSAEYFALVEERADDIVSDGRLHTSR